MKKPDILSGIVAAAEAAFRVGTQYPEEAPRLRYDTTHPAEVAVETESGVFRYAVSEAAALRAQLAAAYPPRTIEPIPHTWTSTQANTTAALTLLGDAVMYMRANPQQALMLSVSPCCITLMTSATPAGYSVTLTPHTAAAHLAACANHHDNAFLYLNHAPDHA